MCKPLESVVRLYHDARFYIHFMENITRTTKIFSYKGSEKTLRKDSKAKSYLKFKRLNNKKGQIFVNCPLQMNLIFSVKLFKREVFVPLSGSVFHTRFFSCCFMLYLLMKTFFYSHSSLLQHLFYRYLNNQKRNLYICV